jgi:cytochrome c oxidase assembly factor CtaG
MKHAKLARVRCGWEIRFVIRLVFVAILVVVLWLLILKAVRATREVPMDWKGIAFAAGFVALAFYLRHATGMS